MRHLSLGLRKVLAGLGLAAADVDGYLIIARLWAELVGDEMARHTSPLRLENGTLFVRADDAAWASEIRWSSQTILAKANEELGTDRVQKVKVRLGPVSAP